jgi:hypothetical protein
LVRRGVQHAALEHFSIHVAAPRSLSHLIREAIREAISEAISEAFREAIRETISGNQSDNQSRYHTEEQSAYVPRQIELEESG